MENFERSSSLKIHPHPQFHQRQHTTMVILPHISHPLILHLSALELGLLQRRRHYLPAHLQPQSRLPRRKGKRTPVKNLASWRKNRQSIRLCPQPSRGRAAVLLPQTTFVVLVITCFGTDDSQQASRGPAQCDDKEGHYIIVKDDLIHNRCNSLCFPSRSVNVSLIAIVSDRTVQLLGQGTFGKVVEAVDTKTNSRVAIKIIRAIPKYRDASRIEIRVLQKLKERDPLNRQYVYRLWWH
jgi:hypothetical protein